MKFVNILLSGLFIISCSNLTFAQDQSNSPKSFIEIIGGYSPNSVILLGKTPDTQTFSTYIGYGKLIHSLNNGTEIYVTRGVIPFSEYVYPKRDNGNNTDIVYGYGISPLGYQAIIPGNRFQLHAGITSSLMLMNETFPTDKGRRINYTFDLSLGLKKAIQKNTFLSLGYRFHHISNAQTGTQNPGIDSNFLFLSIKHFTNVD